MNGYRTTRRTRRQWHGRRGGSLIEMVLVLALLVSVTFGAVEYGYLFFVKNTMAGAARNGARAAIPSGSTNADVAAAVTTAMTAAHFATTAYTVAITPPDVSAASVTPGTNITVTVSGAWGTVGVTPLPTWLGGVPPTKQLAASAVMVREQ